MSATLHLVCGKIAAGKSTLTTKLGLAPYTIVLREDDWLPGLYPNEITTLADYVRCATRLRSLIGPHVVQLLKLDLSVVLDFPANTLNNRAWMRSLFEAAGTAHQLHWLDVPDAVCKARLQRRNDSGQHPYTVSEADFDLFTSHFAPPTPAEGFNLVIHRP